MVNKVKVWREAVSLPTYQLGQVDTNPIFLEKRVYQGSSGSVYPYGVIDSITNKCVEQEYNAVFLENDYILVMIIPELGGRIHKAYDKINKRDFVYCNDVIKPALVGLVGPWISGGIEFNWPQHHRPTTYMPVDVNLKELEDGSAEAWVGEVEHMYSLQVSTGFKLYPDKALIEITGRVFNANQTPQQFLWWSNPAVKGGDDHQSIFPPDVTAVYDHGKRDVSQFPIAKGTYYKVDYSDGVDISRYENLPVPTSYMAAKSDYDFVGAYSHDEKGGLLHIANHHISTGKKQWTWGNCEFGQAWDKQLTDNNGPYIELMTGVFADNQPDFTWIDSNEEKHFVQNFLPYSELGIVHQANTDVAINLIRNDNGINVNVGIYAISEIKDAIVTIKTANNTIFTKVISMSPCSCQNHSINFESDDILTVDIVTQNGNKTLTYVEHQDSTEATPDPATAPKKAKEVETIDELYFIGQHIEQYHHATTNSEDYYLEALKRDKLDYRCNVAMANHEFERCDYKKTLNFASHALKRSHLYNKNPLCGRASLMRGYANEKLGNLSEAYADFYKSTWSGNCNDAGFLAASKISFKQGRYLDALDEIERSLKLNTMSYEAAFIKLVIKFKLKDSDSEGYAEESMKKFPFGYGIALQRYLISNNEEHKEFFINLCQSRQVNAIHVSGLYLSLGMTKEAILSLDLIDAKGASVNLIKASLMSSLKNDLIKTAENEFEMNVLFPNTQVEVNALMNLNGHPFADYLLGCFYYAKKSYKKAANLWEMVISTRPKFKEAHRNLAIFYANKCSDLDTALKYMEEAWKLDQTDARVLYELDDLRKISKLSPKSRLSLLEPYLNVIKQRDDLVTEFVTLLNINGEQEKALSIISERTFAPWEGGEGRVTGQYVNSLIRKAITLIQSSNLSLAKAALNEALVFPENLSEGRLVGQTDNEIFYLLGLIEEKMGSLDKAKEMFLKAASGDTELSEGLYYNDMPADYLLFQNLAMSKLDKKTSSITKLNEMKEWSKNNLHNIVEHDFFAVSLPQLNVFDKNIQTNHLIHCKFVSLLSNLGLEILENSNESLILQEKESLFDIDPSHSRAHLLNVIASINLS